MKNVEIIAQKLAAIGKKVYVVGSYNVHALLHRNFGSDVDLTTPAHPEEIREVLKVVGEIGAKYGTLIVREWGESYEITTFRADIGSVNRRRPESVAFTDSLEDDAKRRDFTFNAIYFEPISGEYIDPVGGMVDLYAGLIRFVGDADARLDEDALRILRFIRLRNKYGFQNADPDYDTLIEKRIGDLTEISRERIKDEIDKMLLDKTNTASLEDLKRFGFFKQFIPHLENLSHTPGGRKMHLEWDVWVHTMLSIAELNHRKCHDVDIYWATLLHDIGKYATYDFDPDGNIHYYRHEDEGAKMFRESIVGYLPFSNKSMRKIEWLIRNHIRVGTIEEMKKIKQAHFMMHPYFQDLITLVAVDNLGKAPPDTECGPRLQRLFDEFMLKLRATRFVTGQEVMERYPELRWREIGERIHLENDAILLDL